MKISVVIRSYNEDEHIERLLLGLEAQRVKAHEIILVDSGSTDRTVEIARRYVDEIVPIDKAEFTFGRALNRGIEAASGDICVFPSAHVYPLYDTWLEKLAAPFRDARVVLAYGRQSGNHLNKFSNTAFSHAGSGRIRCSRSRVISAITPIARSAARCGKRCLMTKR